MRRSGKDRRAPITGEHLSQRHRDRVGALTSITEAVSIRHELATANPAVLR